jgi:hypothetical protein
MNIFSKLYLILWIALIAVEIVGATTAYFPLDTMSEEFWAFQTKFPNLAPMLMTAGLAILWVHLVLRPGEIK